MAAIQEEPQVAVAQETPAPAGLSKDAILTADDMRIEAVAVPEWGGTVFVRSLSGTERDSFEAAILQRNGSDTSVNYRNMRARLAVLALCDRDGNRLFTDGDMAAVGSKSAAALQRVFDAASRLNGLSKDDVDELAKNSEGGPSESATTAGPPSEE